MIRQKFLVNCNSVVILQYFDKDWDSFVDIVDVSMVPNKSKIRCVLKGLNVYAVNTATNIFRAF